jgi:hypothetical protein
MRVLLWFIAALLAYSVASLTWSVIHPVKVHRHSWRYPRAVAWRD